MVPKRGLEPPHLAALDPKYIKILFSNFIHICKSLDIIIKFA